jgi:pimeloyl-ACP methyl ester carboxylesterase
MTERMIEANGVELCTESFGDPTDPPILLIMGTGASMLWWDEAFCRMLADGGRFVIRYDHRDTGRSVSYEPGHPGYTGDDLVADAAGVLAAYELPAANLVGVSAGGAIAQLLALDAPDRVLSLVLISTSAAVPVGRELPAPTEEFGRFVSTAQVDWSDADSVIEYLVDYSRVRQRERLSSIAAPTLVIHGTADPMFPIGHGEALAAEIPGARLLPLEGADHGLERADWETDVGAILEHTA